MIPESIGSFGSITALSVLPFKAGDSIEEETGRVFMLVGMCSRVLVYNVSRNGESDIVGACVALPYGIRVHGIQWMQGALPNQVYIMAYGGRCISILDMRIVPENDDGRLGCTVQRVVTDSSSCPAWILAGCLKPIQRKENAALLSVGMIHNQVLVLYFDGTVLHRVCDFRGNVRAMLYSMDLFDSLTEGDEDGTLRYACHVSGGTMLWDILVWSVSIVCRFAGETLELVENHSGVSSPPMSSIRGRHSGSIHCLAWNSTGKLLASGSDDRVVKVWEVDEHIDQAECLELFGTGGRIWGLCFSPMDSFLFSGSEDGCIYCWDLNTRQLHTKFRAHAYMGVRILRLHQGHLCSGGADGFVKMWNLLEHIPVQPWFSTQSLLSKSRFLQVYRISPCFGEETGKLVAVCEEVAQDDVPISKQSKDVLDLVASYGEKKKEMLKSFETIKAICYVFSGSVILVATDKGRLMAMNLVCDSCSGEKDLKLLVEVTSSRAVPIVSLKSCIHQGQTIVSCCDAQGTLHLMRLEQNQACDMPELVGSCTIQGATGTSRIIDAFIFGICGGLFVLAFSSGGNLETYKIELEGNDTFVVHLISVTSCPLGARITALKSYELSDRHAITVLGSARGGISIWNLDTEHGLTQLAAQMTAHDETPVQFVSITHIDNNLYEIETGAMNFCAQNYVLEMNDDVVCLQRKNEFRIDSLKVISDRCQLLGDRKCYFGFFTTQCIVWDIGMDAEVWNVQCSGWKRPWAFHVDTLSEKMQFCHSSGCGDLHVYEKDISKTGPHCLVTGGHGREINCVVDMGHGVLLTAGADATLNLAAWSRTTNATELISRCISTQPFGTASRMLRALHDVDESIIVSCGAKGVMTAWKYQWKGTPRIQNMSTFADLIVSKVGKSDKKTADSRVLCLTLIPSLAHHILVVRALSNGDVEVRSIPSPLNNHRLAHDWPLAAYLRGQESTMKYPILSIDHLRGYIYAGNTNGDIFIWDITHCLQEKNESTVLELRPKKIITGFHSCGINALQSVLLMNREHSQILVITGGDDQALGLLCLDPVSLKLEKQCFIPNAHISSLRDLCIHKDMIYSIGLDQYLRVWSIEISPSDIKLQEACSVHLQVVEPNSLSMSPAMDDEHFSITVVGRGIETFLL